MQVRVSVAFKPGVLDPEAVAIERALHGMGHAEVSGVRRTKVIELSLALDDRAAAEAKVRRMCEELLANPVIESYRIEMTD